MGLLSFMVTLFGLASTVRFVDNACENVAALLTEQVVGQELAVTMITNSVCEHVRPGHEPKKPLVLSVHGPPGVGKTFSHTLLARALYNKQPAEATRCPGEHCIGAKVLYGLDFTREERAQQLDAVRAALLEHIRHTPDPLIVIEEYDKLDCASRAMLRQLITHPELANGTFSRSIVLLESNLGFTELEQLLSEVGDRNIVSFEAAEARLKAAVFNAWQRADCESWADTLSFSSVIDLFVPYLPLQREQVAELTARRLQEYASRLEQEQPGVRLIWQPAVVDWLVGKVELVDGYPLEGAKVVHSTCLKYVASVFLAAPKLIAKAREERCVAALSLGKQQQGQKGQQGQQGQGPGLSAAEQQQCQQQAGAKQQGKQQGVGETIVLELAVPPPAAAGSAADSTATSRWGGVIGANRLQLVRRV